MDAYTAKLHLQEEKDNIAAKYNADMSKLTTEFTAYKEQSQKEKFELETNCHQEREKWLNELNSVKQTLQNKQEELENVTKNLQDTSDKLLALKSDNDTLSKEITSKNEEIDKYSSSIDKKEALIETLEETINEQQSHIEQLKYLLDMRGKDSKSVAYGD